jgi:hypothetical protein
MSFLNIQTYRSLGVEGLDFIVLSVSLVYVF